jgi:hypothetical protein
MDDVSALLAEAEEAKARLLMSAINVGEVYYFLRKHHSPALADSWRESSGTLPVMMHPLSMTGDPEFRSVDQLEIDWIGRE